MSTSYRSLSKRADICILKKDFEKHHRNLTIFLYIKEGDKMGKANDKYTLYRAGRSQTWARWWYGENRKLTLNYIDVDFTLFVKYLDTLLAMKTVSSIPHYKTLVDDTVEFINNIIPGLYNLKKTYHDYDKLICKIDSIILILIDFKDKIGEKSEPKINVLRRTCF